MLNYGNEKINSICYNGVVIKQVYKGNQLVFSSGSTPENLFDATVDDLYAYIRYADYKFGVSVNDGNHMAVVDIYPDSKYSVTLNMYTRFRIFTYNGVPTSGTVITSNRVYHPLDSNDTVSQKGASATLEVISGSTHDKLFIFYWTAGDTSGNYQTIRDSIEVYKI